MAHSPDKKIKLRAAYIGGLPLEAAADKIGVPLPTARTWFREARAAGDDWDKFQRASMIVAGGGIEASIKAMSTLGDTIAKLNAASGKWMPEADQLAIETAAVKRLADLFVKHHPEDALNMVAVLELFARG